MAVGSLPVSATDFRMIRRLTAEAAAVTPLSEPAHRGDNFNRRGVPTGPALYSCYSAHPVAQG